MDAYPVWFGPEARPLFGWLHAPPCATAGAVLCLPLGDESFPAYRAYLRLAEQLRELEVAVLRFDYTGTGDSAGGIGDVRSVDDWIADVAAASAYVRSLGVADVTLVGLRAGALLAEHAALRSGASGLVLWDPCESGRHLLRELRLLGATGATAPREGRTESDGTVETPGLVLPPAVAGSFSTLVAGAAGVGAPIRSLVLVRPERPLRPGARARLDRLEPAWGSAVEMPRFFDVDTWEPFLSEPSLDQIVAWFDDRRSTLDGIPAAMIAPPEHGDAAVVLAPHGSTAIAERAVTIGESSLFGILTEPARHQDAPSTALLLNTGLDRHIGPSRLWVELAREWASAGARVLRIDMSGTGDSPARPGQPREVTYPAGAVDDVIAAASYLAPDEPATAVLVGTCSGGYHAIEAGAVLRSRAVWVVNPAVPPASKMPEMMGPGDTRPAPRRAARRLSPWLAVLAANGRAVELAHRFVPNVIWSLLDRVGLYAHAARAFRPLVATGATLYVRCGKEESVRFVARGYSQIRRLERSGRFTFEVDDQLDHTLLDDRSRRRVAELLGTLMQQGAMRSSPDRPAREVTDLAPLVAREPARP